MLNSLFPTAIAWGPDLLMLYSDGYRPILGNKHPESLAQACRECWSEIWDVVAPLMLRPLHDGQATWLNEFLFEMDRHGYLEETYFVASYSAIPDGSRIGGVQVICYEVTEQVISARRLRTLSDLAVQLNREHDSVEICEVAARILDHSADLPFALLYLLEADGQTARLKAAAGLDGYLGPANPPTIDLKQLALDVWPLAEVAASGRSLVLDDLDRRFGLLPGGESPVPPHSALLLPLGPPGPAGHYGFLIAGLSPRLLLDDRYRGFLELAADQIATALRKARAHEEELRRTESLARADRAKDEFLAMLGHELRNPLSPIVTVLQLMKLRGESALADERAIIERHVQHVERLVDDLLEVSRLTRGRVSLEREVIDVAEIVSRALEMSSPLIEQRLHTLTVDAPPEPVCVNGDALRLAQVIANLLTNAAKYTEPRGQIAVRWSRDGAEAVVSITDNGHGMDSEFAARVFDSFSQAPTESSSKPAGLGLGLAIVKSLVAMHGGSIAVESAGLGQGSEFTVRLPAHDRLPRDLHDRPTPALLAPSRLPTSSRDARRIMIVDDNEDAAEVLAEALKSIGHSTQIAHDAPSALQSVSAFAPDVMLLDIGLPVMDGYELARAIRAIADLNSTRLIALTGYGQQADRERALEAGFNEHLVKPIDLRRLLSVLDAKPH